MKETSSRATRRPGAANAYGRVRRMLLRHLYRDRYPDIDRTVVVAGTGRSGTTWLAQVLAAGRPTRIVFEPFNSKKISQYASFNYFQYMRPDEDNDALLGYWDRVLTGRIRSPWTDRQVWSLRPQYRVVKTIRAGLMLGWVRRLYPELPIVLILRHPCAVVQSRLRLKWHTDADLEHFLAQPELVEDFLSDRMQTVRAATTEAEKHALIWCISYLIPLSQLTSQDVDVVFYEHLFSSPDEEMPALFEAVDRTVPIQAGAQHVRPSSTTHRSPEAFTGEGLLRAWQDELTTSQVSSILSIVDAFGLSHLYGDECRPRLRSSYRRSRSEEGIFEIGSTRGVGHP